MAISEIAGSAASATLSAPQSAGAQRTAQQSLDAAGQTGNQGTGTSAAVATAGSSSEGASTTGTSRGSQLDITV